MSHFQRTEDALSRDGVAVTRAVYPEAAGAQPVTNTQQYSDGREGFSRRGRPPPVPSTRTITL